jgi:alanine racemase
MYKFFCAAAIAVVKANAYGHGSVNVARHLVANGINHFAVATVMEGVELRQAGIRTYVQVLGKSTHSPTHTHVHLLTPKLSHSTILSV